MTEEHARAFAELRGTGTGKALAEYVESLCDSFCDMRNMAAPTAEDVRARIAMASILKSSLTDKLRLGNEKEPRSEWD